MKTIIFAVLADILAVLLAVYGIIAAFFGLMFRMDPGEEGVALTHDVWVGLILGSACFLAVLALPPFIFKTSRRRFLVAATPSVAIAIIVPAMLFMWQKSILEARRRNAEATVERDRQERLEPGAESNGVNHAP